MAMDRKEKKCIGSKLFCETITNLFFFRLHVLSPWRLGWSSRPSVLDFTQFLLQNTADDFFEAKLVLRAYRYLTPLVTNAEPDHQRLEPSSMSGEILNLRPLCSLKNGL